MRIPLWLQRTRLGQWYTWRRFSRFLSENEGAVAKVEWFLHRRKSVMAHAGRLPAHIEAGVEAIKGQGLCGETSPDGERVCILDAGHSEDHPWHTGRLSEDEISLLREVIDCAPHLNENERAEALGNFDTFCAEVVSLREVLAGWETRGAGDGLSCIQRGTDAAGNGEQLVGPIPYERACEIEEWLAAALAGAVVEAPAESQHGGDVARDEAHRRWEEEDAAVFPAAGAVVEHDEHCWIACPHEKPPGAVVEGAAE